jgi:hypothetical protein
LHLITTSTKFLEANFGGYIPETLSAQTKSVAANHASLATATAAANCSTNILSMISCHSSLLHNSKAKSALEPF